MLGDKCVLCDGKVYLLERQIENGKLYHRACYRHSDFSPTSKVLKRPSVLSDDNKRENINQSKTRKLGEKRPSTDPEPDFWQRRAAAKQKEQANCHVTKMDTTEKKDIPSVRRNLDIGGKGGENSTVKDQHVNDTTPHWKRSKPPELSFTKDSNQNDLKKRQELNSSENTFLSKDKLKHVNGIVESKLKHSNQTNEALDFKSQLSNLKPVAKKEEKRTVENSRPTPQARKKDDKSEVKETKGSLDTNKGRLFPIPRPRGKSPDVEKMDIAAPPSDGKFVISKPTMRIGDNKKNIVDTHRYGGGTKENTNAFKSPVLEPKRLGRDEEKPEKLSLDLPPPLPNSMPPTLSLTKPSESVLHESDKYKSKHQYKPEPSSISRSDKDRPQPHTVSRSSDHMNKHPPTTLVPPQKPPRLSAMDIDLSHSKQNPTAVQVSPASKDENNDKTVLTGLLSSLANVRKHHDDQPRPKSSNSDNKNERSKQSSHLNLKDIKLKEPPTTGILKHQREQINLKAITDPSALVRDGKSTVQTENFNTVLTHKREVITPKRPEINRLKIKQEQKHIDKFQNESKESELAKTPLYRKKEQPNRKLDIPADTKTDTTKSAEKKSSCLTERDDIQMLRKDKVAGEKKQPRSKSANIVLDNDATGGKLPWQLEAEKRLAANKKGFVDPEIHIPHPKPRENGYVEQNNAHHPLPSDLHKNFAPSSKTTADDKTGLKPDELSRPSNTHIQHSNLKKDRKVIQPVQKEEIQTPSNLKKKVPVTMKFSFSNSIDVDDSHKGEKPPRHLQSPISSIPPPARKSGLNKHEPPSRPPPLKSDVSNNNCYMYLP